MTHLNLKIPAIFILFYLHSSRMQHFIHIFYRLKFVLLWTTGKEITVLNRKDDFKQETCCNRFFQLHSLSLSLSLTHTCTHTPIHKHRPLTMLKFYLSVLLYPQDASIRKFRVSEIMNIVILSAANRDCRSTALWLVAALRHDTYSPDKKSIKDLYQKSPC